MVAAKSWCPFGTVLCGVLTLVVLLGYPAPSPCAPRFEAAWSANPARPSQALHLAVTARWEGDASLYAIGPPKPELPEGMAAGAISSRSYREGDTNVVSYVIEMSAARKGEFPAFPLRLAVLEAGKTEPAEDETTAPSLRVDVPRWFGIPVMALAGGAFAVALSAGGLLWYLRKRRRPCALLPPEEPDRDAALLALKEALNVSRVRGDTRAFLATAIEIHKCIGQEETPEFLEIRSLAEQAAYGNLRLSGEEIESWYRRLKRMGIAGGGEGSEPTIS